MDNAALMTMDILPVLDLRNGSAVHARGGDRSGYAALKSKFADSSDPYEIVAGLNRAFELNQVYVADLDALLGEPPQRALISSLAAEFPRIQFVVDYGLRPDSSAELLSETGRTSLIIATESLATLEDYRHLRKVIPCDQQYLSLDQKNNVQLGPSEIFTLADEWPQRVIHMNLDVVGRDQGPDLAGLRRLLARRDSLDLYAAGGVRNNQDLNELNLLGVSGVLVGSALHDGRIDPGRIAG